MLKIDSDEIWTMEDGTEIQVRDMTESHAKNILRMILRKSRERESYVLYDDDDWGDRW